MSAGASIIGQCAECCTCPPATVEWDSLYATLGKHGYTPYDDDESLLRYRTRSASGSVAFSYSVDEYYSGSYSGLDQFSLYGFVTATGTVTYSASFVNETETGFDACSGETLEIGIGDYFYYRSGGITGVYNYFKCGGQPVDCGGACFEASSLVTTGATTQELRFAGLPDRTHVFTLSNLYTTAALKANTFAALPAYSDTWESSGASVVGFANLDPQELSYTIRESRYRLRFKIPKINTGKHLRASWVERFIAEAGVAVSSVEVYARGVYRPTVTLSAPPTGGIQARATAVMASDGTIASLSILNPGAGYIPLITFSGGGGTGAAAIAIINSSGAVTGVTITSGGSGYTSAPTVAFTNVTAPRVRATGTATVSGGVVTGINIGTAGDFRPTVTVQAATGGGTSSTGWIATLTTTGQVASIASGSAGNYLPTLVFSAPDGSPAGVTATATCTIDSQGGIATVTMGTAGTKYLSQPALTIIPKVSSSTAADLLIHLGTETAKCAVWDGTTLGGKWVKREVVDAGHPLTSIEVVHGGNYLPTVTISGPGSGATATVTGFSADGKVTAISVGAGGTGYTSAPSVTITGRNGGGGATATATVSGGAVTGITVVNQGNYLPTLSITPPSPIQVTLSAPPAGGTQATARANVSSAGLVTGITVTSQGSGYTSAPTVTVLAAGTGGTQATGWTANLTTGRVTSITGGTSGDYAVAGTVTLKTTGELDTITLTKTGAGFKTNPTINLSYYGTGTILLAAHFGTETEYADNAQPAGTTPLGYVDGVVRTYPLIGNAGTAPWKYYELAVPETDGTTLVANIRTVCDGTVCP